jgi:hypothetical protein
MRIARPAFATAPAENATINNAAAWPKESPKGICWGKYEYTMEQNLTWFSYRVRTREIVDEFACPTK